MTDKNTIKMKFLKMFFIGPPKVGKTLTRLRLCNEMKNMISRGNTALPDSTLLANCKQVLICVKDKQNAWMTSDNSDEEAQILFKYMCMSCSKHILTENLPELVMTTSLKVISVTTPEFSTQEASLNSFVPPLTTQTVQDTERPPIVVSSSFEKVLQSSVEALHTTKKSVADAKTQVQSQQCEAVRVDEVMCRLQSLIQSKDYSRFSELVESSVLINIHDIGGQPGFLEMIPSLISGPAAYLVFMNLALPLNQPYKIPFSKDSTNIHPFDSMYTVESTISQILSAIASIDQPTTEVALPDELTNFRTVKPVATLVGTHLDQLEDSSCPIETTLSQKHEEVKRISSNFSHVVVNPAGNKAFLAVDNYKGTDEYDLSPLRTHIMDLLTNRLDATIPIRPAWLILSIILRKEFQVAPMSFCLEMGKRLNMDKEEVKTALWYLHHVVGAIIYYPDIKDKDNNWFEKNIICSPQVVFDSISQIIVASMQIFHSDIPVRECFKRDWIEKGLFSLEAIEEAIRRTKQKSLIPNEKLIKLLEHVKLLAQIKVQNPLPGTPSIQLFMPAILECASIEELSTPPQLDSNHPASILLQFEFGYVPTGVFCSLVTHIVTNGPLKILGEKWELRNDYVKRNKVSFYIGELHIVTLLSHDTCYEIRVERRGTSIPLHELCSQVLTTFLYVMKETYEHLKPIISFFCPCDNHVTEGALKHTCTVSDDLAICKCERSSGPYEVLLRDEQKVWIGEVCIDSCFVPCVYYNNDTPAESLFWIGSFDEDY